MKYEMSIMSPGSEIHSGTWRKRRKGGTTVTVPYPPFPQRLTYGRLHQRPQRANVPYCFLYNVIIVFMCSIHIFFIKPKCFSTIILHDNFKGTFIQKSVLSAAWIIIIGASFHSAS